MHDQIETSLVDWQHQLDSELGHIDNELKLLKGDVSADAIEAIARTRGIALETDGGQRWKYFLNASDDVFHSAYHRKVKVEMLDACLLEVNRLLTNLGKDIQSYKEARDREAENLRFERDLLQQKLDQRSKVHSPADRSIREQVAAITDNRCFYCEADLEQEKFHVDHIVPKAAGGPDHISNYVPACARCNSAKSDKPFATFFLKARSDPPQLTVVRNQEDVA